MNALKDRTITAEAFLNRLTFHKSTVCDYLADFPDEICEDLIFEDDQSLDECTSPAIAETANQHDRDLTICPACNERKREVICMPCRHQYFCVPCYEKWASVDPSTFDFMDEAGNIPPGYENSPLEVMCPCCKQPILTVILPIVA